MPTKGHRWAEDSICHQTRTQSRLQKDNSRVFAAHTDRWVVVGADGKGNKCVSESVLLLGDSVQT